MENNIKLKNKVDYLSLFFNFVIASWVSIFVIMTFFVISVQLSGEESIFNNFLHSYLSKMYLSKGITLISVVNIVFFMLSILIFLRDIKNEEHYNYEYIDTEEERYKREGKKNTEFSIFAFVFLSYFFISVELSMTISNSYISNENIKALPSTFKELISEKKICDLNNIYVKKESLTPYTYRDIKDMQRCEEAKIKNEQNEQNEQNLKDRFEEQLRMIKE
jgi:hypothetical protein